MKKIIVLLSVLIIVAACTNKNEIPKPANPIAPDVMENILYDLALLQALKSYSPEKLAENSINTKTYIYQKYKIDSAQFAENDKYLATNIEEYKLLSERVTARLEKEKAKTDTILKKEDKKNSSKIKDSATETNEASKKIFQKLARRKAQNR
ncbi:DUF4296 domain-containing protein [Flavobacterium sp.]|uniref:DUF4296 domain-containing protein n=1 Tax=Flavobacterium sp. TaxID=239 RepID=UPI003D6BAD4F